MPVVLDLSNERTLIFKDIGLGAPHLCNLRRGCMMKEQKMSTQVFIKRIVRLRRHVTQYFVHWSKNDKAASYIFPKDAKLINRSLYNGG